MSLTAQAQPPTTTITRDGAVAPDDARSIGGRAGAMAAIVMLVAQLVWRLEWAAPGVPAFPEIIVSAVARLTPLDLFGTITESVGSLAKNPLFVAVLIGIVGVGSSTGILVERFARRHPSAGTTFGLALAAAAVFWLFSAILVFPVAHLGIFALSSSFTTSILTQTVITFVLFGVLLGTLLTRARAGKAVTQLERVDPVARRH